MKYSLKELVDIQKLQELTDDLYDAAGIPSSIVAMDGEILTGSGWQRICTDFHRKHPGIEKDCIESDIAIRKGIDSGEPFSMYTCPRGLTDASIPIIIEGEHVANAFAGQLFLTEPGQETEKHFREQARHFGMDEEAYIEAYREIPVMPIDQFHSALTFLVKLATMIADLGLQKIQELKAKQELEAKEHFLRHVIDQSPFATWISDAKGVMQYANPTLKMFLNLTDEQLIGKYNVFEDMNVIKQGLLPQVRSVYEEGNTIHFTCEWDGYDIPTVDLKGSNSVSVEATMFPIQNTEGEITNVVAHWLDVTDKKQAEKALNDSETYLANIINAIGDPVFVKNEQFRFVLVNDALCTILGKARDELVGTTDMEFLPADQAEHFREVDSQVLSSGEENLCEELLTDHAGSIRTIITKKTRYVDNQGTMFIVGVIRDITERKQVEEALNESERKYRSLFEKMINGFAYHKIVVDENGKPIDYVFLDINDSFEKLTGLKRNELIGKRVTEALPGTEKDPADWIGTYGKVALEGKDIRFESYSEALKKWFLINAFCPIKEHFVTIFEDITERKQFEMELRNREQILDATGKMAKIGGWQHDLLTGKAIWTKALYDIIEIPYDQDPPSTREHLDFYPPKDRKIVAKAYTKTIEDGTPFDIELNVYTASKKLIWCRIQGEPIYRNGKCVGLRGSFQDITERKNAEIELNKAKNKAETYLNFAGVMFTVLGRDGKVKLINPKGCEILGYGSKDIIGADWFDKFLPKRSREEVKSVFSHLIAGDISPVEYYENPLLRKDGTERIIAFHNNLILDEEGVISGILFSGEDITASVMSQ